MATVESSAIQVLMRAVELDQEHKYDESLTCYEQGIRLLLQASRAVEDPKKKEHYKKKVSDYLARAECLKTLKKEEAKKKKHTQINIPKGAKGYGYSKLFSSYLDDGLTEAAVRDPYIRSNAQLYNFQRFCEMLIGDAPNIKKIYLLTSKDDSKQRECEVQLEGLEEISKALSACNVVLKYNFSDTLHDREIRLNNGWTIKIGRGLDYFERLPGGRFSIGSGNYDLRPCMETTIDIFHKNSVVGEGV